MELNRMQACDISLFDRSYFIPWSLEMIYEVEPALKKVADYATKQRESEYYDKLAAYSKIKRASYKLVGWYARDPRLRNNGAWDCYIDHIISQLNI